MLRPRHDGASDEADEKTDNDGPEDVQHGCVSFGWTCGQPMEMPGRSQPGLPVRKNRLPGQPPSEMGARRKITDVEILRGSESSACPGSMTKMIEGRSE